MKIIVHAPSVEVKQTHALCRLDLQASGKSQTEILGAIPLVKKRLEEYGVNALVVGSEPLGIRIYYPASKPYSTWYIGALDALQEYTKSLPDAQSRSHRSLEIVSGLRLYDPQ